MSVSFNDIANMFYMPILSFSATVKCVEPNAAINLIESAIKDWLKLSSVRVTLAETRKLKRNLSVTD